MNGEWVVRRRRVRRGRTVCRLPARLVHETPFETARETCTTTTSKTRVFDSLDDPGVALSEDILCPVRISARLESVYGGLVSKGDVN